MKNCLSCNKYIGCKDSLKSVVYVCPRYSQTKDPSITSVQRLFDLSGVDLSSNLIISDSNRKLLEDDFSKHKELEITKAINAAIEEKSIVPPDLKIPDGDFPLAKNFYEFTTSPKFLNATPFVFQILYSIKLFGEYCPACSNEEYFNDFDKKSMDKMLKNICFLEHGKCPACGLTRLKALRKKLLNPYNAIAIVAGQRSGKSEDVALKSTYLVHRMLKLQNPNLAYGLARSNVLHGTFVALTYAQAKDTLWDPIYGKIAESPWFQDYHSMLDHCATNKVEAEDIYKFKDSFIKYNHRKLFLYPAGPDKRILRGRTRFLSAIDELGWFPNEKNSKLVKMNATEVYIALERSLLTVRSASRRRRKEGFDVLTGFFLNISSPSSERDKIMELFRKSQTSKVLLGFQKPTWKLNPTIAKKDLAEEYRIDPIAAERDYGANPPLSSNAFLTKNLIGKVMTGKPNCLSVEHKLKLHKDKSQSRYAELQKCRTAKFSSILALDAGHVSNSFALSVGHLKDSVPCIDGVVEIIPAPGASINFAKVYKDVIKPIIEIRNVKLVVADRWNSLKILSDIEEDYEISTLTYSLNYKDMRFFKDCMQFKKIILPSSKKTLDEIAEYDHSDYPNCFVNDPISHFYLQLLTVQDTGFSIIKGDQLTDDMVRASMLAVTMMMDDSYREALDSGEDEQESIAVDIKSMAVVKTLSGGGGMKNSSSSLGAIRSRS